jgi:hypothetical protein
VNVGALHRGLTRLTLVAMLIAAVLLAGAAAARADGTFGGDPAQAITPGLSCQGGAPPDLAGSPTCFWIWSNPVFGSDTVPFPAIGGTTTITAVTLPAMPNPGPMQAVVLNRSIVPRGGDVSTYYCCQVKAISKTFTVPANKVTTVRLNLPVAASAAPNLTNPGNTSSSDRVGISVLSPDASLPLRYVGVPTSSSVDTDLAYLPAPTETTTTYNQPGRTTGYQLLANFSYGTMTATTAMGLQETVPSPVPKGVTLEGSILESGLGSKTLRVGSAADLPVARTTQTLTLGEGKDGATLGRGTTTVPKGGSAPLILTLSGTARDRLAGGHALQGTLTVVATNAEGGSQTVTRTVTVKPARPANR